MDTTTQPTTPGEQPASNEPAKSAREYQDRVQYKDYDRPTGQPASNAPAASSRELWNQVAHKSEKLESPDEFTDVPTELREQVRDLYAAIDETFQTARVHVDRTDPEWMIVEAELEDPTSSFPKTMLAAERAAEAKKKRIAGTSTRELWNQASHNYK